MLRKTGWLFVFKKHAQNGLQFLLKIEPIGSDLITTERNNFQNYITYFILTLIIGLQCGCYFYQDKYLFFWVCMGRNGFSESADFNGFYFHIPIYNPFHFLSILVFFIHSLVLPIGYLAIYHFRKQQNLRTSGLTDKSLNRRKNRNVVTAKINAIIWVSEFCSYLVLIPEGNLFFILYFLVSGTVSPMLYYLGIEANRKAAKDRILKVFKDSSNKDNLATDGNSKTNGSVDTCVET